MRSDSKRNGFARGQPPGGLRHCIRGGRGTILAIWEVYNVSADCPNYESQDGSVPELPLRRLGLDLGYYMGWKIRYEGSTERFDTLFRLLSFTHVESLEFTSVVTIPNLQLGAQLKTVKILRISGSECTFQAEVSWTAFPRT